MRTVIQDQQQPNPESQPRWERFERAALFAQYQELRTQGISERQAAKELMVPRTTLQAWRVWHDTLYARYLFPRRRLLSEWPRTRVLTPYRDCLPSRLR